ncbi:hypothetical protein [Sphingobium limneticum]|uniref:Uncharacterized protein n=1 Tax=Sphingobium limneticum TaxID=1007511 RepID=A0A5J5IBR1_9SPHN|nr:hypothetical protein [Sphingobium limneticum]KAA9020764.1 hypothetical protein F4U96_03610 [Sphingobium limneticum]KAA9033090.1 hypothetical protein F4U95_03610 [Sphingobium limneticum]
MTSLSVDHLDLRPDEMLTIAFHKKTAKWWGVVGRDRGTQRAVGEGDTPIAALGDVLIQMGHRPTSAN